jgi:PST family polysaccharide transporter
MADDLSRSGPDLDAPESPKESASQSRAGLGAAASRGTTITLLAQAGKTVVQFGSMIALARLLVPEDFGLVAMVSAVIGVAELVRDFGLSLAAIQSPTLSKAERDNLFWANLAMGTACSAVAVATAPLIALAYGEPSLTPIVVALASVFVISGFTTQFKASLSRDMRFKAIGVSDLSAQIGSTLIAIGLAMAGAGLWALVAQQILAALLAAIMCVWQAKWWPGLPHRGVSIRRFASFGAGVFGTQAISYATMNVDNIAIGVAFGPTPLGYYSRAYRLMMMPLNQVNAPMTQVALPVLSRVQGESNVFLSYLLKAQLVACYLTATLFAVATGLSEPLVRVLFGSQWLEVVPIFAVLAVGGIFRAVAQIAYWAYLARGKSGALFRQRMVTGPITIVLILAGLPWGPVGVAAGASLAGLVSWIIAVLHVGRVTDIRTFPLITNAVRIICLVGVPAGGAAFLATYVPVAAFWQLLLGSAFSAAYMGLAYLVIPSVRADLRVTASFARSGLPGRR